MMMPDIKVEVNIRDIRVLCGMNGIIEDIDEQTAKLCITQRKVLRYIASRDVCRDSF